MAGLGYLEYVRAERRVTVRVAAQVRATVIAAAAALFALILVGMLALGYRRN